MRRITVLLGFLGLQACGAGAQYVTPGGIGFTFTQGARLDMPEADYAQQIDGSAQEAAALVTGATGRVVAAHGIAKAFGLDTGGGIQFVPFRFVISPIGQILPDPNGWLGLTTPSSGAAVATEWSDPGEPCKIARTALIHEDVHLALALAGIPYADAQNVNHTHPVWQALLLRVSELQQDNCHDLAGEIAVTTDPAMNTPATLEIPPHAPVNR